jgi:hypothetical protein
VARSAFAGRDAPTREQYIENLEAENDTLRADARRWQRFADLLQAEADRGHGALIVWAMNANADDPPRASIQAVAWDNPTRTLWLSEASDIDAVLDDAASKHLPDLTPTKE